LTHDKISSIMQIYNNKLTEGIMPFGKALRKFGNQIKKEGKKNLMIMIIMCPILRRC